MDTFLEYCFNMKFKFDALLKFIGDNWFSVTGIFLLAIHGFIFWYTTTLDHKAITRLDKNVTSIVLCLVHNQVLNPNDVELSKQ